jgi:1-deoxy-D-xylulose-5-phosphate synthase
LNKDNDKILERINSPADLKKLSQKELLTLACEIRKELIDVIAENGGHLAPNLGVVELTIALHTVFNAPEDKLVWDVGHQAYIHKLLTGRRELFKTLRQDDGCLGFLSRDESEYDSFGAGHAGTAISAAVGIAAARDQRGGKESVIAIVGDGSLNCGVSLEGLNNVSDITDNLIIILNDNKMSISPNVGAMARYLNRIISARPYNSIKASIRKLVRSIPLIGNDITHKIARLEEAAKSMFVPGVIFEELGLRYIGPVDGHNIEELTRVLNVIKDFKKPTIIHVLTEKGRGYQPAEAAPEKFHGLSSFDPDTGLVTKSSDVVTFSNAFGNSLCELAEKNSNVVAITAAMCDGTGMTEYAQRFPDRFYDVGIAEEHAVVFAAGLAIEGYRPVVAMYSSFLQRALDYVFHDVCLQKLPVIICTDRSGVVGDGPTHHGIHDLSFLRTLPGLAIMSPSDECELRSMLFAAYSHNAPVIIRYPRASGSGKKCKDIEMPWGKAEVIREGTDIAIWGVGKEVETALEVADILKKKKINAAVVNTRFLKPFDSELLIKQAEAMPIATIEDYQIIGGLGAIADSVLVNIKHNGVQHFGWGDEIIPHGTISGIRKKYNLTPEKIADKLGLLFP